MSRDDNCTRKIGKRKPANWCLAASNFWVPVAVVVLVFAASVCSRPSLPTRLNNGIHVVLENDLSRGNTVFHIAEGGNLSNTIAVLKVPVGERLSMIVQRWNYNALRQIPTVYVQTAGKVAQSHLLLGKTYDEMRQLGTLEVIASDNAVTMKLLRFTQQNVTQLISYNHLVLPSLAPWMLSADAPSPPSHNVAFIRLYNLRATEHVRFEISGCTDISSAIVSLLVANKTSAVIPFYRWQYDAAGAKPMLLVYKTENTVAKEKLEFRSLDVSAADDKVTLKTSINEVTATYHQPSQGLEIRIVLRNLCKQTNIIFKITSPKDENRTILLLSMAKGRTLTIPFRSWQFTGRGESNPMLYVHKSPTEVAKDSLFQGKTMEELKGHTGYWAVEAEDDEVILSPFPFARKDPRQGFENRIKYKHRDDVAAPKVNKLDSVISPTV